VVYNGGEGKQSICRSMGRGASWKKRGSFVGWREKRNLKKSETQIDFTSKIKGVHRSGNRAEILRVTNGLCSRGSRREEIIL